MISKKHQELLDYFRQLNIEIIPEFVVGQRLRVDIFVPFLNLGFEIDGSQHEKFNPFFHKEQYDFHAQKLRDWKKSIFCKEQGIYLYRLRDNDKRSADVIFNDALKLLVNQDTNICVVCEINYKMPNHKKCIVCYRMEQDAKRDSKKSKPRNSFTKNRQKTKKI